MSHYHQAPRGENSKELSPTAFVNFLQNHDQIGNRALGERLSKLTSPAALKAAISVFLLAPGIPLLFMGEEWETEKPFLFFCDFEPGLAEKVREGRKKEFSTFKAFSNPDILKKIPDATSFRTFEASTLDWREPNQPPHNAWRAFYKHLLEIRREEIIPLLSNMPPQPEHRYRTLNDTSLTAQWHLAEGNKLILLASLGEEEATIPSEILNLKLNPIWQSNHQTTLAYQNGKLPAWNVIWAITEE
jgi:1,4-alpha-glucan branching enzyme